MAVAVCAPALAQDAAPEDMTGINEIIVTATKRSQSVNSVPMSITAATGDQLKQLGVADVAGLAKVVPGFFAQDSSYGTPVYYLRGVGFYEQSVLVKAPVGVYVDEVPVPYPVMGSGASFDLERVEVLKGPQGTLFGANATGGAINYIAAKPTDSFSAAINGGYGRFDAAHLGGHVSGALSQNLSARLSLNHESSGDWQRSQTSDRTIGSRNFTQGRLQLLWNPTNDFTAHLTLSGFRDRSDTQQAQQVATFKQTPTAVLDPALLAQPLPNDARDADWNERFPLKRNNRMYQAALRMDYDITTDIKLTSISAYSHYRQLQGLDTDGVAVSAVNLQVYANIDSFNQELRLAGNSGGLQWLLGGNYERSTAFENTLNDPSRNTSAVTFRALGLPDIDLVSFEGRTKFESWAAFGNVDYDIGDMITLHAGARYTKTDLDFTGCLRTQGNNTFGTGVATLLGLPRPVVGQCATVVTVAPVPPATTPTRALGQVSQTLPEDNVSWRVGVDFKPAAGHLIYANVSRGYKSGAYTSLSGTAAGQYAPAVQEELTAYELGFKSSLFDRMLQLNGALFYYDYKDKQLRGRIDTGPPFRFLEALINIPKSRVKGAEFQIVAAPTDGLRLSFGGVYLDSKITANYSNFTQFGQLASFKGQRFPYTPKWSLNGDVNYEFGINDRLDGFAGANLTYKSSTSGDFVPDPRVAVDGYTLLDLRAGIKAADGKWTVSLYGRNVTDKYYWSTATRRADSVVRFAGMPATYGIDFSVKF